MNRSNMTLDPRRKHVTACFIGTRLEAYLAVSVHCEVTSVITVPGSRLHQHLDSLKMPVVLVSKDSKAETLNLLANQNTGLVVSVGFPYILPAYVLNSGPLFINSHPSLLPDYKGYNAIKEAFGAGEEYMGVTVHHMVEQVDAGPIIHQKKALVRGLNLEEVYSLLFSEVEPNAISQALDILSEDYVNLH